ncbi:hypothetical protein V512_014425 [Mesotoga sp. Brook.08.105.5.1]|uniref:DUF881 domain-containing protein n=2 Tax=unclassified Mesotoga TaxID=1184398 RepID=UPI000D5033BE|nr:DUF881 domain-containing protein [Mesotoga sp. Brook.08.105.5.1]PVD18065.1 hypothetical protein V512_014425 [Mesotoga sp. Brook.08.105.5.1]
MNSRFSKRIFLTLMFGILIVSASTVFANEGSCLLKIVAANDLAKTGTVFVDGKLKGLLELGELVIFDLDIGTHKITVDGKLIEKQEIDVAFENAYESKQIDVKAIPGRRAVRIISEPSNALIRVNEDWIGQKTPWQIVLEVGRTYEIELLKDNHGSTVETLDISEKGEVIVLDIAVPVATPPDEPRLVYPSNGATDLTIGEVFLEWEHFDTALQFEVDFNGESYTTRSSVIPVQLIEKGRVYTWKVTAINEFDKRSSSEEFSFTTLQNMLPNEPSCLFPGNGTDNYPDAVILQWVCEDPEGDRLSYDVIFGEGDALCTREIGIPSSKLLVSELKSGTQYFWKVIAKDDYGGVTVGPLWTFSTKASTSTEDSKAGSLFGNENSSDDSCQVDVLKEKIVSLEWALEELKILVRENTRLVENTLISLITTGSSACSAVQGSNYFTKEFGKGLQIKIESDFKGSSILHDSDILMILNEIYALRATKISLNGKRVLPYTYVRCVGATVIIDDEPTQIMPIVIEVLGDYDYLVSGLGLLKEYFAGREIDMSFLPVEFITIPAFNE